MKLTFCPFCGGIPVMNKIGNEDSKIMAIEIKCTECLATMTYRSPYIRFEWVKEISIRSWNAGANYK